MEASKCTGAILGPKKVRTKKDILVKKGLALIIGPSITQKIKE